MGTEYNVSPFLTSLYRPLFTLITDLINPTSMKFGIESKKSCPSTSTDKFKIALVESLREMRGMFGDEKGRARL